MINIMMESCPPRLYHYVNPEGDNSLPLQILMIVVVILSLKQGCNAGSSRKAGVAGIGNGSLLPHYEGRLDGSKDRQTDKTLG